MNLPALFILVVVALTGCAGGGPQHKPEPVEPGQAFKGSYINIAAPDTSNWYLVRSSTSGMEFGKRGQSPNETFAAQVQMFQLPAAKTPEEFRAFIESSIKKDTDLNRFVIQESQYEYSSQRAYPCVRHRSVSKDLTPRASPAPLLLEIESLYCRHPVRQTTGFAAIYSRRGEGRYEKLHSEAERFIESIQAPPK